MQNGKKFLCFHDCLLKGETNFECHFLNLHTLNYHIYGALTFSENSAKLSQLENKFQSISATDENPGSGNQVLLILGNTVQTLRNEVDLLKQKQGTVLAKNCNELFSDATMVSGNFTIDPDGSGPIDSFTVFCDTVKSKKNLYTS